MWANDAEGRTTFYNRRWRDYTGREPAELIGDAWHDLIHPEDFPGLIRVRKAGIAAGVAYECEYRLRSRDGRYRWHIARVVPVQDAEGQVEGWFGTATEIDELKRAEAELRDGPRRGRGRQPAPRTEFLAVLSHELRTPLTPVLVGVSALLEDARDAPRPSGRPWS